MAKTTNRGYIIPEYQDLAAIPAMIEANVQQTELFCERVDTAISSFDATIQSMSTLLGTLTNELDAVNGAEETS